MIATGEVAFGGVDELAAVFFELDDISLGGGVEPHFAIHGGSEEDGGFARKGEVDGGEGIGGEAVGEVAQGVGGEGSDEKEIGVVGKVNVAGFPGVFFVLQRD